MSETSSRSHVQVVSDASISGAVAAAGAVLLGAALVAMARGLSHVAQRAFRELSATSVPPAVLTPACELINAPLPPDCTHTALQQNYGLGTLEAQKVSAILRLQTTPLAVQSESLNIDQPLDALFAARSSRQVEDAKAKLWNTFAAEHHNVMEQTIIQACTKACQKIGFSETRTEKRAENLVRVIAVDSCGRYLVTEIAARATDQSPNLTTEVFNAAGNSCHDVLNAFDQALEVEGIRSAPPEHKPTGGICTLAGTRELARRLSKPAAMPQIAASPNKRDEQIQRARKLNQRPRVRTRQE